MITSTITFTEQSWKSCRLELDGVKVHLLRQDYKRHGRKPRVYVWGTEPDMERPPYSMKGDDPELDARWRAYNRAELKAMRAAAGPILAQLKELGLSSFGDGQLAFSRTAGCSCGCSPGFVFSHSLYAEKPFFQHNTRVGDVFIEFAK